MANAIDNSNLKNYRDDQGTTGFLPDEWFVYDANAKHIDVSDHSLFPAGITLKKVHVRVCDKFGKEVRGEFAPPGDSTNESGEVTIDVATLDASRGLDITATVIASDGRLVADGSAMNIGAAGKLGGWDIQKNA